MDTSDDDSDGAATPEPEMIPWPQFLANAPPTSNAKVSEIVSSTDSMLYRLEGKSPSLQQPDLLLHCGSEGCDGQRTFECIWCEGESLDPRGVVDFFLGYRCRNCQRSHKTYAVGVQIDENNYTVGVVFKYGERPPFGPPIPSRVIALIGPDRDLFLQGRRAENQSMGIGAFAYYRRVVENQKDRLLDEVIKVTKRVGADPAIAEELEAAKKEIQFSRAVDSVKEAIPQVLRIDGQNPLTLLHTALSKGLHAKSDEECLEYATAIRVVLVELADRIGRALKDQAELKTAVGKLLSTNRDSNLPTDNGRPN